MRVLGYALAVVAALLAFVGLFNVVAPGGTEPEAIRALGVFVLALAAVVGLAATFVLRSGNAR